MSEFLHFCAGVLAFLSGLAGIAAILLFVL